MMNGAIVYYSIVIFTKVLSSLPFSGDALVLGFLSQKKAAGLFQNSIPYKTFLPFICLTKKTAS